MTKASGTIPRCTLVGGAFQALALMLLALAPQPVAIINAVNQGPT